MSDNSLTRLERIASELFPGRQIETRAQGEGYYVFKIPGDSGGACALPPIWIDSGASDQQIKNKLAREFERAFHEESSPDDLSVPNLQTEADRPKQTS